MELLDRMYVTLRRSIALSIDREKLTGLQEQPVEQAGEYCTVQ